MGMISFDLDGVLRNFTRGFTRVAYDLFGTPVGDPTCQQTWGFEDFPNLGLSKEQCHFDGPIWKKIRESAEFWRNLDPLNPTVMLRINRLKNKVFITNTVGVDAHAQSVDFLERWGVYNPTVVLASDKGPAAVEHRVVAHLDDYLPNCAAIRSALPLSYVALLYVPYSKTWTTEWTTQGGEVALSVDHFLNECDRRGLSVYNHDRVRTCA